MRTYQIEATKFALLGVANFGLTLIVFTTMMKLWGVNYLLSLLAAWVVGMFFSYVLNFVWVFKTEERIYFGARFTKFVLAGLISIIMNVLALSYIFQRTGFDPFYIQAALIPIVVVTNFLTAKFWSLRPTNTNEVK